MWLLRTTSVILFLLFAGCVLQIEHKNANDREKYRRYEVELNSRAAGLVPLYREETRREKILNSWAGTWSMLVGLSLTVANCVFMGFLRP